MIIDKILTAIFGSANDREVKKLRPIVAAINAREEWAASLKDEDFAKQTKIFNQPYKQ